MAWMCVACMRVCAGLLMFDYRRFLTPLTSSGTWEVMRCADVVCHEMAHQW